MSFKTSCSNFKSLSITLKSASITVFPVINILFGSTPSLKRFFSFVVVGAKWRVVIAPVNFLFASSGNGEYISYVLSPASMCPTGTLL